MIFGYQLDAVL